MATVKLTAAALYRLLGGAWPPFGVEPWYLIFAATAFSTPFQAGEEVGWRGYALPRLGSRMGLARASLLLGLMWAAWHLPLFLIPGVDDSGQSFPLFVLEVTALSVAMAWLWERTGGSLFLVMLMHSAVNNTTGIVPSTVENARHAFALSPSRVAWMSAAVMWTVAGCCLVGKRGRTTPRV